MLVALLSVMDPGMGVCGESGDMRGMTAAHNRVRTELGVPPLAWSDDLADRAGDWARYLAGARGCRMVHHGPDWPYGENLFWASAIRHGDGAREVQSIDAEHVVSAWVSEAADYSYVTNSCRPDKVCGHYTQVVWRDTRVLGCGRAVCPDKGQVWVCMYDPPGNFVGRKPY